MLFHRRYLLVDFDHVAFRVIEEHLVPFLRERGAIVRVWHVVVVEQLQEGRQVIGAKGDVAVLDRVDDLTVAERDPCE